MAISIKVLSLDYWVIEQRQARDWLPLVLNTRKTLRHDAIVVNVTSTDPTLLNLVLREGWLISANHLNAKRFAIVRRRRSDPSCRQFPIGKDVPPDVRKAAPGVAGTGSINPG